MRATYQVELQTGYELSSNDIIRIQERMEENLRHLAEEYLAKMTVVMTNVLPGPHIQRSENTP
jgi:hypothetical protein